MSFEQHFKGFRSYILTFQYFGFLMNFCDFRVFAFGYRVYNENPEITENLYFLVYNTPMHVDLCFDHNFNCLSVKTDKKKNGLNLMDSEGSKAFKTPLAAAWLAMWLNHCEFDVIWHSHISVFWGFSWISVISDFSFLGIGPKTKTQKSRKIFIFGSIMFKCMWVYFSISISTLSVLKPK